MSPHLKVFFVLLILGASTCFPWLEERSLWAQGRNLLRPTPSDSATSKPKADELTAQTLSQSFQREFQSGSRYSYLQYALFFLFLAVLIGVLLFFDFQGKKRNKSDYDDPNRLFRELSSAHRLTAAERKFLYNFAEDLDLEGPLPLFIEPNYFYHALGDTRFERSEQMLRYFLLKLFDIKQKQDMGTHFSSLVDQHSETTILVPSKSQQ